MGRWEPIKGIFIVSMTVDESLIMSKSMTITADVCDPPWMSKNYMTDCADFSTRIFCNNASTIIIQIHSNLNIITHNRCCQVAWQSVNLTLGASDSQK